MLTANVFVFAQGRQYCFLSNIDNLGATVDTNILDLVLAPGQDAPEFVMEVTDKTKADVKVRRQQAARQARRRGIALVPRRTQAAPKPLRAFRSRTPDHFG